MSRAIILIGAPYSGKSTLARKLEKKGYNVVSSDDYLERWARKEDITYTQAFKKYASKTMDCAMHDLRFWADNGDNIVVDMTNMTRNSRAKKIDILQRAGYRIDAYVFHVSEEETARRVTLRPNKVISPKIIADMNHRYEVPSVAEGFSEVVFVSEGAKPAELAKYIVEGYATTL